MCNSKICFKCQTEKPLSEFYIHRAMKDGYLNKCKECCKAAELMRRREKLDEIREYDRQRGKLQHRKDETTARTREKRRSMPGYMAAHNAIARALKKGTIVKMPCAMCGSIMSVAHHDDYTKPLDVMWLCTIHHKARHAFLDNCT